MTTTLSAHQSMEASTKVLSLAAAGDLRWSQGLTELRKSLGMNQSEFAKAFNLTSRRRVSELENGTANPTVETLEKIGKPFGLVVGLVKNKKEGH